MSEYNTYNKDEIINEIMTKIKKISIKDLLVIKMYIDKVISKNK